MAQADENASTQIGCICYLVFLVAEPLALSVPFRKCAYKGLNSMLSPLGLRIGGDRAMGASPGWWLTAFYMRFGAWIRVTYSVSP